MLLPLILARCSLALLSAVAAPLAPVRAGEDTLRLVETTPLETKLGSPDIEETFDVWLALIQSATRSIDVASFYIANRADSKLEALLVALEGAAARGVRVRFLGDTRFYTTYPEDFDRLDATAGIEQRRYDMRADTGGVMHAKYLIVDEHTTCLGSANFDWRSLEHIQELGVVLESAGLSRVYRWAFEHDWALAGDEAPPEWTGEVGFPIELVHDGEAVRAWPALAPTGRLGDESWFDLPRLGAWIDSAEKRVWAQVLTYRTVGYDRAYWDTLESALRRAAARGVDVRLTVADWGKRAGTLEGLQSLTILPNVTVSFVTLPEHSSGHIPFARVVHAKYCVVDGTRSWLGSSNWEHGYFHTGRNVGVFLEGASITARLARFHRELWESDYAERVDPCATYEVPRFGER